MAEKTDIAWADSTFNPFIGCTEISPACNNCYAREYAHRFGIAEWGTGKPRVRTSPANWKKPLQWNARPFYECPACGQRGDMRCRKQVDVSALICPTCGVGVRLSRRRVFCASLSDVFDNEAPAEWRRDLFDLIHATPNLDWMLLTKRIGAAQRLFDEARMGPPDGGSGYNWLANVWLGATICNQEEADRDIPKLLALLARVRFLSMEPLLGPVDLTHYLHSSAPQLDWVIVGGESGPNARLMHPDWARSLRDLCADADVPFFFKQQGEWAPRRPGPRHDGLDGSTTLPAINIWPCGYIAANGDEFRTLPPSTDGIVDQVMCQVMWRVGTKAAGNLLDGREHKEYPAITETQVDVGGGGAKWNDEFSKSRGRN